jgi:hypothetical protein
VKKHDVLDRALVRYVRAAPSTRPRLAALLLLGTHPESTAEERKQLASAVRGARSRYREWLKRLRAELRGRLPSDAGGYPMRAEELVWWATAVVCREAALAHLMRLEQGPTRAYVARATIWEQERKA